MIGIFCALFLACGAPAPEVNAPPSWSETALVAMPLIERWEGLPCDGQRCAAYLDRIAQPSVWTTYGITARMWGRATCAPRPSAVRNCAVWW